MSQFVNYNKRSVQLPPGCKDLIDVFKPARLRKVTGANATPHFPVVPRDHTLTETLGNIEKHVAMVFDSTSELCFLAIGSPDESLMVVVSRMTDSMTADVTFLHDETREIAMRAFFGCHGLKAPMADGGPVKFPVDVPDSPVWCVFSLVPMPAGPPAFSKIAASLFRDICGMNDQSKLHLSISEAERAK